MNATQPSELLPCPFCNGSKVSSRHIRDGQQIFCVGCGASARPTFHGPNDDTLARAKAGWNTRAVVHAPRAPDEELRACIAILREDAAIVSMSEWLRKDITNAADLLSRLPAQAARHEAASQNPNETDWRKIAPELAPLYDDLCSRLSGSVVDEHMERIARTLLAMRSVAAPSKEREALEAIVRGATAVLLDAALGDDPINPDVLQQIVHDARQALASEGNETKSSPSEAVPHAWHIELDEIIGHLGAVVIQCTDADDRIIIDHVKAAHEIAKIVRRKA